MDDWASLLQIEPWPPAADLVFRAAGLLVIAGLLGELAFRILRLPRILGYGAVGMLLTLTGHGLTPTRPGSPSRLVLDLALALLLFELGSRVNLRWLRVNPALLCASVCEATASGAAVFFCLEATGMGRTSALACACMTGAASGSVVSRVVSEFRASGQVSERVMALTALNTLYAVLAFKLVSGWIHLDAHGAWLPAIVQPLYALAGSLLLAALLAHLVATLTLHADLRNESAVLIMLGLVVLVLCVVRMFNLSTLLVPLLAGVLLRNATARPWVWPRHFGTAGGVLVLMLFVMVGSAWTVDALVQGARVAALLLAARLGAKLLSLLLWARPSGMEPRQAFGLALALSPISGTTLVLLSDLQATHPALAAGVTPVILAAIAIMEPLGPLAVQGGLELSGETPPVAAPAVLREREQRT